MNNDFLLDQLKKILFSINLNEPIFIIDGLNMNLLNPTCKLFDFINNYGLKNYANEPTRICMRYFKQKNQYMKTKSLIDIVLHNGELIESCQTIDQNLSDHNVQAKLEPKTLMRRNE